jgi:hypothetical protein
MIAKTRASAREVVAQLVGARALLRGTGSDWRLDKSWALPTRKERDMLTARLRSIVVGVLGAVILVAPASADEFTDSLALFKRAMAGHWSGKLSGTDGSGQKFEVDDAFTFVVTSADGLDSATWSASSLEVASYEGDTRYRIRIWNRTGRQSETDLQVRIAEGPDASGNGVWLLDLQQRASDGTVMEARERFSLDENTLRMSIEMRPEGSDEPFDTKVVGTWARGAE